MFSTPRALSFIFMIISNISKAIIGLKKIEFEYFLGRRNATVVGALILLIGLIPTLSENILKDSANSAWDFKVYNYIYQ